MEYSSTVTHVGSTYELVVQQMAMGLSWATVGRDHAFRDASYWLV